MKLRPCNSSAKHLDTSRLGKRRTAEFALRVSNLSLHEVSNSVSEVSQITNPDPRELFPVSRKLVFLENL